MTTSEHTDPFSALMFVAPKPDAVMVRGQGSQLWDQQGKRYLDCVQGWAVNTFGHCPELVQRALAEQAGTLINASPAYFNAPSLAFADALTRSAKLERVFFCSSGAEANEGAIKLARRWGSLHRPGAFEIISMLDSFHGRTLATMAASGKLGFAQLFPPAVPGFVHVPYGDLNAVKAAIRPQTVAVMLEPIQGEAGVVTPPPDYLSALRDLTQAHGILLILDEIQTGMGRTGRMFACEHAGVRPDIMTLGKGIGAGLPLAALLSRSEVACFARGDQGGTYSSHPLQCAVGLAVLRALEAPGFLERVAAAGEHFASGLRALSRRYALGDVRGQGMLWALELGSGSEASAGSGSEASAGSGSEASAGGPSGANIVSEAFARGLLINSPRTQTLRFMPALNVTTAELDECLTLLDAVLQQSA